MTDKFNYIGKDKIVHYGLIGFPLSHSFSPGYFKNKFDRENITDALYGLFELKNIAELPELLQQNPQIRGLNVTIPYKQAVIPFLDELGEAAAAIGAVNVITIKDGYLKGYNSDAFGFEKSLIAFLGKTRPAILQALVLGTGGASKAVKYILDKKNIPFQTVSRSADKGDLTYDQLSKNLMVEHSLIINTTPLGMAPKIDEAPTLPYEYLTPNHYLYDLVYNPSNTLFMQKGKKRGASVKNGYDMLVLQAERSWSIWNGE